ncbi:hypothetical protein [Nocardia xishanensis]
MITHARAEWRRRLEPTLWEDSQRIRPSPEAGIGYRYQLMSDENGEPLLHLSTFGSKRVSKSKSSQSSQIDRTIEITLKELLYGTFGLTAPGED